MPATTSSTPIRAGLLPIELLPEYRASSYWHLWQPDRPAFLRPATALIAAGELADTQAGRNAYAQYLAWQAAEGPCGRNRAYVSMSKGWALGSDGFKADLIDEHDLAESSRAWETGGLREIREAKWSKALAACLRAVGKTEREIAADRKSASWKGAVAAHLKGHTQADNRWLAGRLNMGTPVAVSRHAGQVRRGHDAEAARLLELMAPAVP